jgi:hypothetical protein
LGLGFQALYDLVGSKAVVVQFTGITGRRELEAGRLRSLRSAET